MSDWTEIYSEIDEKINANGIKAISGDVLNEVLTKMIEAVDGNLPEAGTEYTAGANITITNGEIDTKRVVELTDITIANGASAIKIITTDGGKQAVAEGLSTIASGDYSHAEGGGTQAIGVQSHAEGGGTQAEGINSHAEGLSTTASGDISHAEGSETIANHKSQHVFGEFNIADPSPSQADARGNYVEIVGNGTSTNNRSNARTLDWQGNEVLAGTLTVGGNITSGLFFGQPIETKTLNGTSQWTIDDLRTMMRVVLSGSTNTITLPNGGENPFRFQIIIAQDSTGSRALTISGVSGVNVYNPSEFDFSSGFANQICVCTIIWDGTEYIYECTNYVGGE